MELPGKLVCEYEEGGYTNDQKGTPVMVMARTLSYEENQCDGLVFISVKESEFQKMYDYFTSDTNDIIILNQDVEVVSSNEQSFLNDGRKEELEKILKEVGTEETALEKVKDKNQANVEMYMTQKIQGTNFRILGIIDPESAFLKQYDVRVRFY